MPGKQDRISSVLVFSLAWLVLAASASAGDRRADPRRLTIMTFNAKFLWDGASPEEGQVPFAWRGSPSLAEAHMAKIAEVIRRHDPDIVNLVEVEHLAALERFNDKHLGGLRYKAYLVQGRDTYTGQDVALLTRVDPDSMTRFDGSGTSGSVTKSVTKNYIARMTLGEHRVALIGIHLLAQPGEPKRVHPRQAQAEAVRQAAIGLTDEGYDLIVWGDMNDYDGVDGDLLDHQPITDVLQRIRGVAREIKRDDLTNVIARLPAEQRYTAFWDQDHDGEIDAPEEFSAIDHILLSPALSVRVTGVEIDHSFDPRVVSDHFPIIVRLEFPGAKTAAPIRIASLLPNPSGDERQDEAVTVISHAARPVSLAGWMLRDLAGKTWKLDELGEIAPGMTKTIRRAGQSMALNNSGDTVELIDPSGVVVHRFTYDSARTNEVIVVKDGPSGEGK